MRRRRLLFSGFVFALSGCTNRLRGDEDRRDDVSPTNQERNESEPDIEERPDANLEIVRVDAPTIARQFSQLEVTVTLVGNVEAVATVSVSLLNLANETVARETIRTTISGEETITASLPVTEEISDEETTIHVEAASEAVSDEASTSITITTPNPDWQDPFEAAAESITAFLDDLAAAGSDAENRTILDTTITDEYRGYGMREYLAAAEQQAIEAYNETNHGTAARARMHRLRDEVKLLESLRTCQRETCETFSELEDELQRFKTGDNLSGAVSSQSRIAQHELRELSGLVSEANPVIGSEYESKVAQIDGELELIGRIVDSLTTIFIARNQLDSDMPDSAFDYAQSASHDFEDILRDIQIEDTYPPVHSSDDDLAAHVEEWQQEAVEIERQA